MRITLCSLIIFLLVGCQEYSLQINKAGEFRFRRSYADIQFREMPSKEIDSIRFSNPVIEWESFSNKEIELLYELREGGVLDPIYDLDRSKFPDTVAKKLSLTREDGSPVEVAFLHPSSKDTHLYDLVITNINNKANFRLEGYYKALNRDISYLVLDLIPGGYPEIVVLNEYYIMNGDNSDIYIYEITD